jgi:membrane protein YdbS with pleckstrin-like domain
MWLYNQVKELPAAATVIIACSLLYLSATVVYGLYYFVPGWIWIFLLAATIAVALFVLVRDVFLPMLRARGWVRKY